MTRLLLWLLAALVVPFGSAPALAHDLGAMLVEGVFDTSGQAHLLITVDPEHLPPDLQLGHDDPASIDAFASRLLRASSASCDGKPCPLTTDPTRDHTVAPSGAPKLRLSLSAVIPATASRFAWRCDLPLGQYLLRLANQGDEETTNQWLQPGQESRPFLLNSPTTAQSDLAVIPTYLKLGFTHIVPDGLDHILFVLGLFLLSLKVKPILSQVTAFTIAHSITLGLSIYGVVRLPPTIVEPAIALSIALIGFENLFVTRFRWRRVALVFAFGLLHGMGFAGVLQELGLPRAQFLPALVSFNVGVELGQLAVIAAAFLAVGLWCGAKPWYRARVTVPTSICICLVGIYWTVLRAMA